ncbi:MAG: type VI secretion system tube protein Hcp [Azoarcus sp.]|jgi:type VI secretion system secreted protein Hcp|nr:type VI secretion system tube protein Hcp [Azoarcus sp.]
MAFDAFLKIDGIPGESTDSKYKDWIEVLSYDHTIKQPVSYTASSAGGAGGATVGRVNFGEFSITKEVDIASPKLLEACCTGKHIKEITLKVCRAGGDKQECMEIRMEQVLISDYTHLGGGDFPSERISFAPGTFNLTYSKQGRADGTPGGNVAAGWSLITNKSIA